MYFFYTIQLQKQYGIGITIFFVGCNRITSPYKRHLLYDRFYIIFFTNFIGT